MTASTRTGRSLFPAALVVAAPLLLAAAVPWQQTPGCSPSPDPAESSKAPGRTASPNVRMESAPGSNTVSSAPVSMPPAPPMTRAGKQALIVKDGSPLRIELVPGNPGSAVDLQAWTEDQSPDAEGHYTWRFRVTAAAGGLVERGLLTMRHLRTAIGRALSIRCPRILQMTSGASRWQNPSSSAWKKTPTACCTSRWWRLAGISQPSGQG